MKMIQISNYVKLVYQMPLNKVVKIKIGSCKMHKLATKDCARIQLRSGICENFAHGRGYLRPGHGDGGGDAAAGIFTREEPRRAPAFYTEPGLQRSRVRSGTMARMGGGGEKTRRRSDKIAGPRHKGQEEKVFPPGHTSTPDWWSLAGCHAASQDVTRCHDSPGSRDR